MDHILHLQVYGKQSDLAGKKMGFKVKQTWICIKHPHFLVMTVNKLNFPLNFSFLIGKQGEKTLNVNKHEVFDP